MSISLFHIALFAVAGALLAPIPHQASELVFPDASPAAMLQQRVGLTDITLAYGRPGVKGRTIFEGLQPYGEVWRTGANTATRITFSTDVKFGGADVPAGSYSLFSIPGEKEWTVILNKVVEQWGAYSYDEAKDLLRVKAKPTALAESVETMTIGLSDVRDGSATLEIVWEKTRVPVKIETNVVAVLVPQIERVMAGEGKKPYLQAAMFYYENDLDLKKASAWMDAAIEAQPDQMWMIYRKGLILEKLNDKPGAIAAAKKSMELAAQEGGLVADEYTRLNQMLISRCR